MVDESAFHQFRLMANVQSCIFEKAILATCCACSRVKRNYIAERESIVCADSSARATCQELHQLLCVNSAFALHHIHPDDPLTHAQELRLQCGGLKSLSYSIYGEESVADAASLVSEASRKFGNLQSLPYSQIIKAIASYKLRQRHNSA